MAIKVVDADIVTAFAAETIGTRVVEVNRFRALVAQAIEEHDFSADTPAGQGFLPLPDEAIETVSCGVGRRTADPVDYHPRLYRGVVGLFLKREKAAKAESVAAVVYTADAYLADPEVKGTDEERRIRESGATHALVAVLASVGPKPPVSSDRFVKNLAGGNRRYSPDEGYTLEKAIAEARQVAAYHDEWCTVAD